MFELLNHRDCHNIPTIYQSIDSLPNSSIPVLWKEGYRLNEKQTAEALIRLATFKKALQLKSSIYLNTVITNLLKEYIWQYSDMWLISYPAENIFHKEYSGELDLSKSYSLSGIGNTQSTLLNSFETRYKSTLELFFETLYISSFTMKSPVKEPVVRFNISLNNWGEWTSLGDTEVCYADTLAVFVGLLTQNQQFKIEKAFTKKVKGITGHDYCYYCGTDNGPNGELRLGHDCCHCGSN